MRGSQADEARRETAALPTASGADPLIGCILDGRYRVEEKLGSGGVGAVYKGEHLATRRRIAIKMLHSAFAKTEIFRKRFEREARSASRLSHPGCVSALDFGHVERVTPPNDTLLGTPYLVMEFVAGDLLAERLDDGKMPPPEALLVARGVLAALRHAHQLQIVHRDIKPANIMLSSLGDTRPLVKLLDFGLAKNTADDSPDSKEVLTEMGTVFGTPGYLSPEQAGGKPADARSDLYSLGVVLFEMICGTPPFVRAEQIDVVRDHMMTPPPSPKGFVPSLSSNLEATMLKALEKDPARRFQSAEAFQAALAGCPEVAGSHDATAASSVPAASTSLINGITSSIRTQRRRSWVIATGLASIIVLALWAHSHRANEPAAPTTSVAAPETFAPVSLSLHSSSAERHLALADDYAGRLWCSDAVDELQRALRDDPQLRADPTLTRIAIPCLRAKTQAKTMRFLVESVGAEAKPQLEAALAIETKPDVRDGAQRTLEQLR